MSQISSSSSSKQNNNNTNLMEDNNESNTTVSLPRTPIAANVRFLVALGVLITQGLGILFCQGLLAYHSTILHYVSVFCTIFITFFSSEWIRIHSFALTRQKRAFFDESNILETYQPRSRTHGHLFQPDPPTPGPIVKFKDDSNAPEGSSKDKAAFNAMRDAHYENMFEYAARVAKEAEESDRQALNAQKSRLSQGSDVTVAEAIPKGEPIYEDLPTNPPVDAPQPPPQLANGTALELPSSLMEKSESSGPSSSSASNAKTATASTQSSTTKSGQKRHKKKKI
uniref:Uncharacterized protein n=1 Tax=Panagrolaimus sp. ES5 TaxID=591445 RepID=A0AC34FDK7_9BILA